MCPVAEVHDSEGNPTVQPGDEIDVMVQHGEAEEGYVALSYQKAQRIRVWDDIEKAYNDKTPIKGKVVERVKGGLSVDIGARAFLPGSQVDLRPVRNLDALIGQDIEVRSSSSTRSAATSWSRAACSKKSAARSAPRRSRS